MVANRQGWKVRARHDQARRLSQGRAAGRSGAEDPSAHSYRRRGGRLRATQGPGRLLGRPAPRRPVLAGLDPEARASGDHGQPIDSRPGRRAGVVPSSGFIALKETPHGASLHWGGKSVTVEAAAPLSPLSTLEKDARTPISTAVHPTVETPRGASLVGVFRSIDELLGGFGLFPNG